MNSGNTATPMDYESVDTNSYPVDTETQENTVSVKKQFNYGDPTKLWIPLVIILLLCNIGLFSGFVHVLPKNVYNGDIAAQICAEKVINCLMRPGHHCCSTDKHNVEYCYIEGAEHECVPLDVTVSYLINHPGDIGSVYRLSLAFLLGDIVVFIMVIGIVGLIWAVSRDARK